jgi:hypothetical protein
MLNQVFISYRQESPEHARAVRRLGELLRQAKLPIVLDQFFLNEHPGGPDDGGWPKWCEDHASQSACVVIVASEGWFTAYEDPASVSGGFGAASEARLFRQDLYDQKGNNKRIRIAFLHSVAADKVPPTLRAWHQFHPFDVDAELDQLVEWIADCLGLHDIQPPTVRWPAPEGGYEPDLANRQLAEWPAIVNLLAGTSRERILLFKAESGLGKSALFREAVKYAKQLQVPVAEVNFKGGLTIADLLGSIDLGLSPILPNFSREGASKTPLLRKDLRALRQPALVVFDHYEDVAGNKMVVDWLSGQLLAEVETSLGLAVIVGGQAVPDRTAAAWRSLSYPLSLGPITKVEPWEPWVDRHYPTFREKGADLPTVVMFARGIPAIVAAACEAIAGS